MKSDAEAVKAATDAIVVVIDAANETGIVVIADDNRKYSKHIVNRETAMFIVNQLTDLSIDPEEATVDVVRAIFAARDRSEGIRLRNLQQRPWTGRDVHDVPNRWWKVVNAIDKRLMATTRIRAEYPEDKYDPFFNEDPNE